MFEKHKESRKMDAEAQIKAETENATREVNKALSAEQLTLRRDWTAKQTELKNELFVEVKNHLRISWRVLRIRIICAAESRGKENLQEMMRFLFIFPFEDTVL